MRQSKLFIKGPLEKLSRDILALDVEQCGLVIGLLTGGHCTLRWCLHVMGFLDNVISRKCGQEKGSS
jgi:hypothetical protein